MEVRGVLFDLGNTLVGYYPSSEFPVVLRECLQSAAKAIGLSFTPALEEEIFQEALALNPDGGNYTVRPLHDRLNRLLQGHVELDERRLSRACEGFLIPIFRRASPDPEAIPVLRELRRLGVRTAIVSNTPWGSSAVSWHQELSRHGLADNVDAIVFCMDVGYRKPHPAPFQRALALLSLPANETIFVGDDPQWDIAGAEGVGLRPVLLTRDVALRESRSPAIHSLGALLEMITADRNVGTV